MMVWIIPMMLMSFGIWRFYVLSRTGLLEAWLGLAVLVVCIVLSCLYLAGALTCAALC